MSTRLATTHSRILAGFVTFAVLAPAAQGQWTEGPKVHADDASDDDYFGGAAAISDDVAIVGAEQNDEAATGAGAVYIFRRSGNAWTQEAKLLASDAAEGDALGSAVAIDGDVAVAGSSLNGEVDTGAGAVYVFRRNGSTWQQEAKLTAADGAAGDRFGISVGVSGNTIIVGAYTDDDIGSNSGSVYVFRHNGATWQQVQKLHANDPASNAFFGFSVAIEGTKAIIGATGDNDNGIDAGAAYVFRHNGASWVQQDKLLAADGDYFDGFGFSVDLSSGVAIVGAFADVVNGNYTGSAYIFRYNGVNDWAQEVKLLASDLGHGDLFGQDVAISGDVAIVGADREDQNGTDSGAAYVYRYLGTHWVQQTKLMASDGASNDNFGRAVAVSGKTAVIGAWRDDDMGSQAGAAYIVEGVEMIGEAAVDRLGRTAANIGDVDGDGVDDLVAGAPFNDENGSTAGKAYVFSGATSSLLRAHLGQSAKDRFGEALAGVGDVNGDGTPDYAVGAPRHKNNRGAVYVYSGANGAQLMKVEGVPSERLGSSVAGGTDANGDGHDDLLVGAPFNSDAGSKRGKAYLISGADGSALTEWAGEANKDQLGYAVAVLHDDVDGHDDLAVGAPWNDDGAGNAGKVYLFSGDGYGLLFSETGVGAGDQFGRSLASAGRVDGDGRDDLVVGSPLYDKSNGNNAGRIDVLSGATGERIWAKVGQNAGDRYGWAVAGIGDANGDGTDDVAAAAPWNDSAGGNRGRIYVRSGINGGNLATYDGDHNGDLCGYALARAGDLDDDGLGDLWIGAPHFDAGASNAGRVYRKVSQASAATAPSGGDVNGDGAVDAADLIAAMLGLGPCADDDAECGADVDDDGMVDLDDVLRIVEGM